MKAAFLFRLASLFFLVGCVTTHDGVPVTLDDKAMSVSCASDPSISEKHFATVSCTFENSGDAWKTIEVERIDLDSSPAWKVSSAAEIHDFVTAYRFKNEQVEHNTGLVLAGLSVAGMAVAVGSGSQPAATAGALTAVGASGAAFGRVISKDHGSAQYSTLPRFGEEHMLGGAFRVPPGLFVRKRILLETKDAMLLPKTVGICLSQPKPGCFPATVGNPFR